MNNFWWYTGVTVVFVLFIVGYMACALGRGVDGWSWRRAWCRGLHEQCDWQWTHNIPEHIAKNIRPRWVGRYHCRRCRDWSNGSARWEESARTLDDTESA